MGGSPYENNGDIDDNSSVHTEPPYGTDRHRSNSLTITNPDRLNSGDKINGSNRVGAYSPLSRRRLIDRFLEKRRNRIWKKRIKYDVRKHFADSRLRVKGRFVRKEDEEQLRDFLAMT